MDAMLNRLDRSLQEAGKAVDNGDCEKLYISVRNAVVHSTAFRCAVMCQGGNTPDADAMLRTRLVRLREMETAFLRGCGIGGAPFAGVAVRRRPHVGRGGLAALGGDVNPVLLARIDRSLNLARESLEWNDCKAAYEAIIDGAAGLAAAVATAVFAGGMSAREASEALDTRFRAHKVLAEAFYEKCVSPGGAELEFEFTPDPKAMTWMNGLGITAARKRALKNAGTTSPMNGWGVVFHGGKYLVMRLWQYEERWPPGRRTKNPPLFWGPLLYRWEAIAMRRTLERQGLRGLSCAPC